MRYQFLNENIPHWHITAKCNQAKWPNGTKTAWKVLSKTLAELQEDSDLKVHAFVLMSNHYHLLCSIDLSKDLAFFNWFHELASTLYLHETHNWESVLGGVEPGVFRVTGPSYYQVLYRYVYRNPVESFLSDRAEDYPYSTLHHILQGSHLPFKCMDDMNLIFDPGRTLRWINNDKRGDIKYV